MAVCQFKGCINQAVMGQALCVLHRPAPIASKPDDDIQVVEIMAVPRSGRYNEAAMKLCGAAKALDAGHALKIKVGKFAKGTLLTAQRYARDEGLRIGLRVTAEFAWIWKMTAEEIKASEEKGQRLMNARGKRKVAKAAR